MSTLLIVLLILICLVLSFFVLIQNPKGGGLSGAFGGFGGQVMGVKKSTDAVERGTWYTIGALVLVTLLSFILAERKASDNSVPDRKIGTVSTTPPVQQSAPKIGEVQKAQPKQQANPSQNLPQKTEKPQAQPSGDAQKAPIKLEPAPKAK